MKLKALATVAITTLAITACSTSPVGRNQLTLFPEAQLNQVGVNSFEELKKTEKISTNKKTNAYVQCVADHITTQVPAGVHDGSWEVVVFSILYNTCHPKSNGYDFQNDLRIDSKNSNLLILLIKDIGLSLHVSSDNKVVLQNYASYRLRII